MSVAEVKFNPLGFAYVRFFIRPSNKPLMLDHPYKVDTGANSTTISREALQSLGYEDTWVKAGKQLVGTERPTVATGEPIENCYMIALPEIQLGGYVGYNWPFIVSLNDKIQFRLLLGTDSMKFFNWNFDYENGVCKFDITRQKMSPTSSKAKWRVRIFQQAVGISPASLKCHKPRYF